VNLKNISKEELELLSYTDLTYMLIKENKESMNTPSIFKRICELLDYSDEDYTSKIGDYYTSLTIDKRFVLLENNEWDLRENHSVELVIDDEEEIEEELEKEDEEDENDDNEDYEEDIDNSIDDDDIDEDDDDIEDLAIVTDDEIEEI
jgi:DNA-directed RNA polymerase subunit delta